MTSGLDNTIGYHMLSNPDVTSLFPLQTLQCHLTSDAQETETAQLRHRYEAETIPKTGTETAQLRLFLKGRIH